MDMEADDIQGVLVLKPMARRIDSAGAPGFKSAMVDHIIQGSTRIALDLSQVDFMDSSGLSALLSTYKTISRSGRLVLFGTGTNVAKLFSITRLDKGVFEIYPDQDSAVKALTESKP